MIVSSLELSKAFKTYNPYWIIKFFYIAGEMELQATC